jgi:large subunit ribosomal protein L25
MADFILVAKQRNILGRKVKVLRKEGLIPAHVFGHNVKTQNVSVNEKDFRKVYEEAGETGIVDLKINSTPARQVLIRGVQTHPLTSQFLHIDFYQVSLKEKVKVEIPLDFIGEAPAAEKKIGLLLTPVGTLEIEALPQDLPDKIEVDISKLENVGDQVTVGDLKVDRKKIEILVDPELVVANIGELVTKEAEEILAEEEKEREEAVVAAEEAVPEKAEEEIAEEKPAEEKPAEETPSESKSS